MFGILLYRVVEVARGGFAGACLYNGSEVILEKTSRQQMNESAI